MSASEIRRRWIEGMRSSHWRWHLDEIFVEIIVERHYLWRAVDNQGEVLESFVTKARDKKAVLKFPRRILKTHGRAGVFVTDDLRSYGAAVKEIGAADRRETGRWLNNRSENSHLPFRRRKRAMLWFRACQPCGNLPRSTHPSSITSTRNAPSPADPSSRRSAPPLSPSGAVSAQPKGQHHYPCGDALEFV